VRWGHSTADKAEAVLHGRRAPAPLEEIFDAIGPGYTSLLRIRSVVTTCHHSTLASLTNILQFNIVRLASLAEMDAHQGHVLA
jgi:hypothetical protein